MGKTQPKPTKRPSVKASGPKPPVAPAPLTDEQVGPIPGLPSEADIAHQLAGLSDADKATFAIIRERLAIRLGSYAAARAWLTAPGGGYEGTPLDAIRKGNAALVLEELTTHDSPNPPYA